MSGSDRGRMAGNHDLRIDTRGHRRDRFVFGWRAFKSRMSAAGARLGDRALVRWDRVVDRADLRWSRSVGRAVDAWESIADIGVSLSDRLAERRRKSWEVLRRPIVIAGIVIAALAVTSGIVLFRAWTGGIAPRGDIGPQRAVPTQDPTSPAGTDDQSTGAVPVAPTAAPTGDDHVPGIDVHVNESAGFLFSYPSSWQIGLAAGIDRLQDPTGDVVMTFDVAPSGTLRSASDRVVAEISSPYTGVELDTSPVRRTPQGLPSLVVGGHGTDSGGGTARFMVITIEGPDGNRAIVVHFSPDAQPLAALPALREIIASYRISTA